MTDARLRLEGVTGVVLAGGRSSRYGSDKLVVRIEGRPLLHHAVSAVADVADRIIVVAAAGSDPGMPDELAGRVEIVHDAEPFAGPLAGINAALARVPNGIVLVVGGDMPTMVPGVLHRLAAAVGPGRAAAILGVPGRIQPLPVAMDSATARVVIEALLGRGERSLRALLDEVGATAFPAPEWLSLDPSARTIDDIDRPADLERRG